MRYLLDFLVAELLAERRHEVPQLGRRNEAVPVLHTFSFSTNCKMKCTWKTIQISHEPIHFSKLVTKALQYPTETGRN